MIVKQELGAEIQKDDWWDELDGRVIQRIKVGYFEGQGSRPHIRILMKDGKAYAIIIREGVFLEGCFNNLVRNTQDIDSIRFKRKDKDHSVEVWAKTFPLFIMRAINRGIPGAQFPFQLFELGDFDG